MSVYSKHGQTDGRIHTGSAWIEPLFTSPGMLVQAAVAGQGVTLARGALAVDALVMARLYAP